MANIELVIKISEEKLSMIKNKTYCGIYDAELYKAIENGIKLPKGHGRIIDESKITKTYWEKFETKPPLDTMLYKNRDIIFKGSDAPTVIEADGR